MADIAASVLAQLKNKAKESGRSYQLCMQLFCQEEFLRRLEKSEYAENLVLKGGLFIYSLTDFDSRVTVDVDFLLHKIPNTPEQLFDFDGITLTEALKKTFENRNHNFTVEQFEQMLEFDSDDAMQKKWKAFIKKINTKTDDFETVLKTIKVFLEEPYTIALSGNGSVQIWSADKGEWIERKAVDRG